MQSGIRFFVAAILAAAFALTLPGGPDAGGGALRAQGNACALAKAYADEQIAAGRSLNTFSGEEARWILRTRFDPSFIANCSAPPKALAARVRGEYPDTGEHQRMNCHLAFDYLLGEVRAGEHRTWPAEVTQPEKEWAMAYSDSLKAGTACPSPPEMLAARASGHLVATDAGRAALDASYNAGDSDATLEVGMLFLFGKGVPANIDQGFAYLAKAAEMGNPWGQYEVALFHMMGKVQGASKQTGFALMKQAAEAGLPTAMRLLATYYAKGEGTPVNGKEAVAWAQRAGEAGEITATGFVGLLMIRGDVVRKNEKEGLRLIEAAARAGDSNAMGALAGLLAQQDNAWKRSDKIWYWYRRARERGNPTATQFLAQHEADLTAYLAKPEPEPYRPKRQYCPIKSSCIRYVHHASGTSSLSCNTGPDYWNCRDIE